MKLLVPIRTILLLTCLSGCGLLAERIIRRDIEPFITPVMELLMSSVPDLERLSEMSAAFYVDQGRWPVSYAELKRHSPEAGRIQLEKVRDIQMVVLDGGNLAILFKYVDSNEPGQGRKFSGEGRIEVPKPPAPLQQT